MALLSCTVVFLLLLGCTAREEKPCDYPVIENGRLSGSLEYHKNDYFPMRIGQHADYHCNDGYSTPSGRFWAQVVCSERGWSPEPKCLKNCHIGQLENGYFPRNRKYVYKEGERVKYVCSADYYPEHEDGEVTCTKDDWSPPPRCIRKKKHCDYPVIENGRLSGSLEYHKNDYFPMRIGQHADYHCNDGYSTPSGRSWVQVVCSERGWSPEPKCLKNCHIGQLENGYFPRNRKYVYKEGERVKYVCSADYYPEHEDGEVTCTKDDWSPPPRCIRKREGGKCGPPPVIENGDLLSFPMQEYRQGTILEYKCPSLYVLEGSRYITCADGQWTSPPVCLVACTTSEEDMSSNNIELKWVRGRKLYSTSGDFVEFKCRRGYVKDPASPPFRVQCVEGMLEYPRCKPGRNCILDERTMELNRIQLQSSRSPSTSTYRSGDYIDFECKWFNQKVSRAESFRAECLDGVIRYPTCEPVFG